VEKSEQELLKVNNLDIKSVDEELCLSLEEFSKAYNTAEIYLNKEKNGEYRSYALSCQFLGFIVQFQQEDEEKAIELGTKNMVETIKFLVSQNIIYKILCQPIGMDLSNSTYEKGFGEDKFTVTRFPYERKCFLFYFIPTYEFGVDWLECKDKLNNLLDINNFEVQVLSEGELPSQIIEL
jgi:hypothetical protein